MLQDYIDIINERIAIVAENGDKRTILEVPAAIAVQLHNFFHNAGYFSRWHVSLDRRCTFSISWS